MSDETKPLDLEAIEERAEAATPGPWTPKTGRAWYVEIFEHPTNGGLVATITTDCGRSTVGRMNANAEFIAAARTDVPALVAEVRRLRERELQPGTFVRCRCGSAFPPKKRTGMGFDEHTCPGCRRAETAEDRVAEMETEVRDITSRITGGPVRTAGEFQFYDPQIGTDEVARLRSLLAKGGAS